MRIAIAVALLAGTFACAGTESKSTDALARAETLQRARRMTAAIDKLESELHAQDTEMGVNVELRERHGQVSQLACQVTKEHVNEIHRLALAQEAHRKQKQQQRLARVASNVGATHR